jgi:hypothetical protein
MGKQLALCVCGVLDGAWAYSASPEKSALSDRLTQHLAGWGIFLDCASKRQRLRSMRRGSKVQCRCGVYLQVPYSAHAPGRLLICKHSEEHHILRLQVPWSRRLCIDSTSLAPRQYL